MNLAGAEPAALSTTVAFCSFMVETASDRAYTAVYEGSVRYDAGVTKPVAITVIKQMLHCLSMTGCNSCTTFTSLSAVGYCLDALSLSFVHPLPALQSAAAPAL